MNSQLPSNINRFIRLLFSKNEAEIIEGDLRELYMEYRKKNSISKSKFKLFLQVIGLLRPQIIRRSNSQRPTGMSRNLFKVIIRNLRRKISFSTINVLGLSTAMVVSFLILSFVHFEMSYDKFHKDYNRIFRVTYQESRENGFSEHWARVPVDWVNELPESFPQIETFVRFQDFRTRDIIVNKVAYREEFAFSVDKEIFDLFDFKFLQGQPDKALAQPFSVVLTERLAKKYFKEEDPVGKEISVRHPAGHQERYTVTALIEDLPANTHLPINLLTTINRQEDRTWWAFIYLKLTAGSPPEALESQLSDFVASVAAEGEVNDQLHLQALSSIHLQSHLAREIVPNGQMEYVIVFLIVGIVILIISIVNFSNLNTVQSLGRSREVGIRKVLGGSRGHLASYFYMESVFLCFVSLIVAIPIFFWVMPMLELFLQKEIPIPHRMVLIFAGLLVLIIPWISSTFPAQVLSRLAPIQAIREKGFGIVNSRSRKILVGFQFALAIGLISAMLVTQRQFRFMQAKNLGLSGDQVIAIKNIPQKMKRNLPSMKQSLQSIPGIEEVSACMELPSSPIKDGAILLIEGQNEREQGTRTDIQIVDLNFPEVMDMEYLAGGALPEYLTSAAALPPATASFEELTPYLNERSRAYVINESAMKIAGWTDPAEAIGKNIRMVNSFYELKEGPIAGVVRDFHQESLKTAIDPVVMVYEPLWLLNIVAKVNGNQMADIIRKIETLWSQGYGDYPLEITFLDEEFAKLYAAEKRQLALMTTFTYLTMIIAFLGVFGLLGYSLTVRQKEIAVRKVLGANLKTIVSLLSKEYMSTIIIGGCLIIPIVWFIMSRWLDNYAYHVPIDGTSFLMAFLSVWLLWFFTVASQIGKANRNPAEVLNNE